MLNNRTGTNESLVDDLIFELAESREAKFCIGVCDEAKRRERLTAVIVEELKRKGIQPFEIKLTPGAKDLVDHLRERESAKKRRVAIVNGFDDLAEDTLNHTLSYLNFKRDILLSMQVPILFWFTNNILSKVVARAPDFWSRRTVTRYFNLSTVSHLIEQLFANENKTIGAAQKGGKVFQSLQKVFSYERELEQITQYSKEVSPLEIDRLVSGIQGGIHDLITESHLTSRFEIAFRLWILAGIDKWLSRVRRNMKAHFATPISNLYEERTDILLKVTEKIERILDNYLTNLASRVSNGKKVNLLGYFTACVENEAQRMFDALVRDDQAFTRTSYEEIKELPLKDERLQVSLFDDFRLKAADELRDWLESKKNLPKIFSEEEGKILRLLYRGKKSAQIAEEFHVTEETAKQQISKLKSKVIFFLAADSGF